MNEIRELMDCFDASGLAYLEVETEGGRVKMKKAEACGVNFPQAVPPASAPAFSPAPGGARFLDGRCGKPVFW